MLYWYLRMRNWLVEREEGQDLIEYALLAAFIAIAVIAILPGVRDALVGIFQRISDALVSA